MWLNFSFYDIKSRRNQVISIFLVYHLHIWRITKKWWFLQRSKYLLVFWKFDWEILDCMRKKYLWFTCPLLYSHTKTKLCTTSCTWFTSWWLMALGSSSFSLSYDSQQLLNPFVSVIATGCEGVLHTQHHDCVTREVVDRTLGKFVKRFKSCP